MSGCEGSDGAAGAAGSTGATGPTGPAGPPGPGTDTVEAAVASANVESCSTCHDGAGDYHQAVYDDYADPSDFVLTIGDVDSVGAGPYDVTIDFSITYMGAPFDVDPTSPDWVDGLFFAVSHWDDTAEMFQLVGGPFDPYSGIRGPITNNGGGSYTLTASLAYNIDSWDSGAIVGKLTDNEISFPDGPTSHFHVYDDLSVDAFEIGLGSLTADYESAADVEGCEACHGAPYRKHGNVQASAPGAPDFTYCKSCHYDDRNGGHTEWQYMVDDPANWAAGNPETEDYSYIADVMNDTHMSHAMEFPYPQSMSNCSTCHIGPAKIAQILDDSNFRADVCKSCHVVRGTDAWPDDAGATLEGQYAQANRPPPLEYLWERAGANDPAYHFETSDCQSCHGGSVAALTFDNYHSGYDSSVFDANGVRHTVANSVAISNVTIAGDLLTVNFTATNPAIAPTLAISFYGWDTKNYIVPAHERDGNHVACAHPSRPGCNIEWSTGSTKPFFTEDPASVAGDWMVTFDMSLFQAYKTDPIPQMIADNVVKYAEISVLPRLDDANGDALNLDAVSTTFDLGGSLIVDNYFQGDVTGATVSLTKCNKCHENLGVLGFHQGRGRAGDSMQVCKVCHNPTFEGHHMEMQSRSIDSYVHAIHAFQPFDEDGVYDDNDAVFTARNELHKNHTFPNFTALSCEGCHLEGTYNVPDQSKSMPGVQSPSYTLLDPDDRSIGTVPDSVTGAASRACGSCHRAEFINVDDAGGLASFDAHTAAFGTFVENTPKDDDLDGLDEEPVLFGIIDKIMSLFE